MTGSELLISGGKTLGADGRAERMDILVRDGRIAELAPSLKPGGAETIDASDAYVLPGLINAHYHSAENFNPGLYENLPLDLWFIHSHQVTRTEPPSRDTIYSRTMLGAMLMLRNGVTCVVDFLFEAPEITLETLEPVVQAYRDAGMRATVLLGVADLKFADSLPLTADERAEWSDEVDAPRLADIQRLAEEAVERWHEPDGLIQIGMGPSAPQRCSEELLSWSLDFCRSKGLPWQTHVLETKTQAMTAQEWNEGSSFVEVLAERGQLDSTSTLVHTVWLAARDIELMAEHGTPTVHCPMSNLRLGDGVAPVPALLRAGVRVALGTDGRGCAEPLDVLELSRLTTLLNKARGDDHHRWLSAREGFEMATSAGSLPAGHGESIGRIEQGAKADLITIPVDAPALVPLHDPLRQIVLGASGRDVRDVLVDGELVVRDGSLTGVDESEQFLSAARFAESEMSAPAGAAAAAQLEALLSGLTERTRAADTGIDSYLPELPGP